MIYSSGIIIFNYSTRVTIIFNLLYKIHNISNISLKQYEINIKELTIQRIVKQYKAIQCIVLCYLFSRRKHLGKNILLVYYINYNLYAYKLNHLGGKP